MQPFLAIDIASEDLLQIVFVFQTPWERVFQHRLEFDLRVDASAVDAQTGLLQWEAAFLFGQLQFDTNQVKQICSITTVQNGEAGIEANDPSMLSEQSHSNGVKRPTPQRVLDGLPGFWLVTGCEAQATDACGNTAQHFCCGPPRERQQQNSSRVDARVD